MTGGPTQIVKIPVSGGELEAELQGRISGGAGPAILFLHGWTLDRRAWAPQRALSAGYPVIAIDRRGFGRSTAPAALHLETDDIVAIQDFLTLRQSVIVGMSQAGRIALDFAAQYPKRTAALVLEGSGLAGLTPPPAPEEIIPLDHYRSLIKAGRIDDMRAEWRRHPLMRSPNPDALKIMDEILQSYDGRDLLAPPSPAFGAGPDALEKIDVPVLAVTGDQETPWRQMAAEAIADGAPNGRRAIIQNAGHVCNLCNPEQFNAVLSAFLNSVLKRS